MSYDDDSSVQLNSLGDFEHYTEIKPIASIGVMLSWTYLIKFKNKQVPEKQEISLFFRSDPVIIRRKHRFYGKAETIIRIEHTERTWGVDIESLLTGHVKTLFKNPTGKEMFIYGHSGSIGLATGLLFFLGAIAGVFITSSRFLESYLIKVHSLANEASNSSSVLSSKLDLLIDIISTGAWPRFIFAVIVFIVISLILSIALGGWVGDKADNKPASYVLLSKAVIKKRAERVNKLRRDWLMFGFSIVASFVTSFGSNIFFAIYFGGIG